MEEEHNLGYADSLVPMYFRHEEDDPMLYMHYP